MMVQKSSYSLLAAVPLAALLGLIGCTGVFATQVESTLGPNAGADDHMAASMLYQAKAQQLAAEADRYETAALKIGPYEDLKGFRRAGLRIAVQEKRGEANQLEELYAVHYEKAQTMYGKKNPD
ncbi:MAG: hypothetical protein Q8N00_04800 [Nitrospirota bacterium]|nr:hypothetical protein [Nitrospirota bacterium]